MKSLALIASLALCATAALAKLPAPSDEAKAKAAETAAKSAHGDKVAAFQLCKSMDQVAAGYQAGAKKAGKDVKPPTATAACADPGAFVYPPPVVAATGAAPGAPAAAPAAAPSAAPAPAKAAAPTLAAAPAPAKK